MRPASSPLQSVSLSRGWRIQLVRLAWPLVLAALPATSGWAQGTPGLPSGAIWVDQFGSEQHDYAGSMAVHETDVYVTSFDYGSAYLRKYDANGDLRWEHDISSGASSPVSVWADRAHVCVGGTAQRSLEGDDEPIQGSAGYVRCFDPEGSVLWTRYIKAATTRPDTGVYALAGDREQILVVGSTTNGFQAACRRRRGCTGGRGSAVFFQKYHVHDGTLLWSRQIGSAIHEIPVGGAPNSSGGTDVWGIRYQSSPIVSRIESWVWLRRLDPTGGLKSTAEISWGFRALPTAFTLAGTAFYVAGYAAGPSGLGAGVWKYDWDPQQGLLRPAPWSAFLASAEVRGLHARGSTLLVAGKEPAPGGPSGLWDAFVRELDVEGGSELWSIPFGTRGDDQASAVAADASRIYVAGYTGGTLGPGPNQGETDAFIARFAQPFAADAGGPYSVDEGSSVTLSASTTAADDGQTLTYAWDLDGDGVFEETGQTAAYAPRDNTADPVIVRVRVTDDYSLGQAEATATVTVRNVAPIVDAGPDAYVAAGQGLSRSVVFTDPGADTWSAVVDWGDGTVATSSGLTARSFTLAHVYGSGGTYTVTVTVADKDGGTGADSFGVTVWAHEVTIADIIAAVRSLVDQGVLNPGQGNSLVGKLQDAQAALDAGDTQKAVEHLNAFINEVEALQNAGVFDSSQAGNLIAMAQAVIASISG